MNLWAMELLHILGYIGALLTGFILGLLGGGGALLSIPVLVYLFHIEASVATGYSLLLVGVTASSSAIQNVRKKLIDYNAALYYGVPSVITVFAMRRFVMPALPKVFFTVSGVTVDKNHFILLVLTALMLIAAYKMIKSEPALKDESLHKVDHFKLAVYAVFIGMFLGLVGAGGGFLMVPALIYFANVEPKKAIGTSLVLVSINSFIGFLGDVGSHNTFDWPFLFTFLVFSITGLFIGHYVANFIHSNKLKIAFGWFILVVAIIIVVKEVFFGKA